MNEGYIERLAVVVSVGLHVIVALILLSTKFELDIAPVQKLIEVVNYGVEQPLENGSNQQVPSGLRNPASSQVQGSRPAEAPENINLPKTISQSDNELINPVDDLTAWNNLQDSEIAGNTATDIRSGLDNPAVAPEAAPESEEASVKADKDFLADLRKRVTSRDDNPGGYTLSGEIINRKILAKVIPEYPAGLQQNSEVELKFEVNPDGTVRNDIVITLKGGPLLDQVSLEALRQWKFSPVSGEHIQSGTIKFRYRLE